MWTIDKATTPLRGGVAGQADTRHVAHRFNPLSEGPELLVLHQVSEEYRAARAMR
jgi:hypothetical protein